MGESLDTGIFEVEMVRPAEVERGDVLWAEDDGDWLTVERMVEELGTGWVAYRRDGSEATFQFDKYLLRRVNG